MVSVIKSKYHRKINVEEKTWVFSAHCDSKLSRSSPVPTRLISLIMINEIEIKILLLPFKLYVLDFKQLLSFRTQKFIKLFGFNSQIFLLA